MCVVHQNLKKEIGLSRSVGMYFFHQNKIEQVIDFTKKGYSHFIACGSIVWAIKPKGVILRWSGGYYQLSKDTNRKMTSAGGSGDEIELELGLVLFLCLSTFFLWWLVVAGVVALGS